MSSAVPLHVTVAGSGPAPVVFLHGFLGQGRNLAQAARGIGDLATSLLVDAPNHGRSGWTEHFDYPQFADIIAGEITARGAAQRPALVVGHSMGGKIAMCLTLRHPELVARLVVVDASPVRYEQTGFFERVLDAMAALDTEHLASRDQADAALSAVVPDARIRGFLLQNLHRAPSSDGPGWRWRCNLGMLSAELDEMAGFPDPGGASWQGPVLWLAGARSDHVQASHAPAMHALFPRTRLVRFKDAGHWVHADQPQVFTRILRAFLQSWPAGLSPA
ncbi:alpha/beta fold hydrolase [Propionibacterium australiense]|uniref:Alpha/beta fold hydrolase n=1 Tax=Propionibacterium australiense TaxID=119981 RepID=A0A383S2W1_9ACTN|nr:alpha/beta fold hydrolase [Propionibacterium australiense]RLP11636.1 alpha/beta fold hydrolase [Propionibacterium australiense]RLP12149.1 alpha/beta fold hydrolase [Propionibacterium australiense]SYZ32368.1 Alpha/beta hydrolase fold-1 [Propionibacterium australiense]VEH90353.1 Esterase ybfF [Propionibacterium australiense]